MHLLVSAYFSHSLTAFCSNKRFFMQLSLKHTAFVHILVSIYGYDIVTKRSCKVAGRMSNKEQESGDHAKRTPMRAECPPSSSHCRGKTNKLGVQSITFSAAHLVCRNVLVHSTSLKFGRQGSTGLAKTEYSLVAAQSQCRVCGYCQK